MSQRPSGRSRVFPRLSRRSKGLPRWPVVRLPRPKSLPGVVVLLAIVLWLSWLWSRQEVPNEPTPPQESSFVQVWRVIDGDTLELVDGTRVRLIGVDTPELGRFGQPAQPLAHEATRFTQQFLAGGPVRLQNDPYEQQDRYGRRLAYVWVEDRMLNEELLRAGLARTRIEFHYAEAMKVRFSLAEQEARQARRGLWASLPF